MTDIRKAIVEAGAQRTLQELLYWVCEGFADESQRKGKDKAAYLYILMRDLEIALMRYKQRYVFEDDDDVA